MTWSVTTKEQLDRLAERLAIASQRLRDAVALMISSDFPEMHTHFASADTAVNRVVTYANDVTLHLANQIDCLKSGEVPEWQKSQRRSLENRLRAKNLADQGHLLKPPTKVAKKPRKRAR